MFITGSGLGQLRVTLRCTVFPFARRETIKEPDPSVLKRFELAVPKDAHVGQDSCTRTLLVAFQSHARTDSE